MSFWDPKKGFNSALGLVVIKYQEESNIHNQELKFSLKAENSDFSANTNYFYIIARKDDKNHQSFIPIMRSEILNFSNEKNEWKEAKIPVSALVTGKNAPPIDQIEFQIQLYRHSKNGHHKILGSYSTTIMNFVESDPRISIKGNRDNEYFISKSHTNLKSIPSFLDYINSGLDMNLIWGIDFTASNRDSWRADSLHYIHNDNNQYLSAIREVSRILLNFDSDQQVPLFGFGAVIPQFSKDVSHWFAMNGDIFNPEVYSIQGIIDWYKTALKNLKFSGPTYFAPLISFWNEMVRAELEKNKKKYYIFLILTDGAIHDIDETVDWIVESSSLPISIIIIGIGNADFEAMNFLDADDERLFSKRHQKFQERDNVQFVEFNNFKHNPNLLARETLEELPRQMIDFYQSRDYDIINLGKSLLF